MYHQVSTSITNERIMYHQVLPSITKKRPMYPQVSPSITKKRPMYNLVILGDNKYASVVIQVTHDFES